MYNLILGESKTFPGKNHEDMLLEMCSELIGDCYANGDETIGFFEKPFRGKDIPWFEVCVLHLPEAMATPNNRAWDISKRVSCHVTKFYNHPKHPVDYLYGEYNDTKVWKNNINKKKL